MPPPLPGSNDWANSSSVFFLCPYHPVPRQRCAPTGAAADCVLRVRNAKGKTRCNARPPGFWTSNGSVRTGPRRVPKPGVFGTAARGDSAGARRGGRGGSCPGVQRGGRGCPSSPPARRNPHPQRAFGDGRTAEVARLFRALPAPRLAHRTPAPGGAGAKNGLANLFR